MLPGLLSLAILAAPAASNPKVDRLAKEGHWLEKGWAAHGPMLNRPAPNLALSGWVQGEVTPAQMKGQIVVVDFWATWCGPCRQAVPHNNEMVKKYASKGVILLGACGGGQEDQMPGLVKSLAFQYPTAKVSEASKNAWNVQWWPTYAVVDRQGVLRGIGLRPDAVEPLLEALLEEQPLKR